MLKVCSSAVYLGVLPILKYSEEKSLSLLYHVFLTIFNCKINLLCSMVPKASDRAEDEVPSDSHDLSPVVTVPKTPPVENEGEQFESQAPPGSNPDHAVPDGGWGWVCVGACFTINAFTWGVVAVCTLPACLVFEVALFCAVSPKEFRFLSHRLPFPERNEG